jgi:GDPmannose 4,6-dehydratase
MKVLITGVTGQDGSNMVRFLLENTEYLLYGAIRRLSVPNHNNINDIDNERFKLINLDITDQQSINNQVKKIIPDYIINFAAQSYVNESWNTPINTFTTNTLSVIYFLESIREYNPQCKFYSAGSSEEFGDVEYSPQDINHPLKPRSIYGASKCAARHIVKVYRDSYNLFAIHCILFNHEGIRRGYEFVTRKITSNIARIKMEFNNNEKIKPFEVGNIYAKRDWSDSEEFVEVIWSMLNLETPKDYILSSNETHSVKEFIEIACEAVNFKYNWINLNDKLNIKLVVNNVVIMKTSEKYYRPADVDLLLGDSTEIRKELNWKPKINFKELVYKMVNNDLKILNKI